MTKRLFRLSAPVFGALTVIFSGCIQDRVAHHYTYQRAVYQSLAQAHELMKSGTAKDVALPGKIALYKNYLFISDKTGGIHVIDNKDPRNPVNLSYITLFGNSDIAISNDVLYADDGYQELVTFDISNPADIKTLKFIPHMFYYGRDTADIYSINGVGSNEVPVLTGYVTVDTTIYGDADAPPMVYSPNCANCSYFLASSASPSSGGSSGNKAGITGSTARFAVHNNYLYALNGQPFLDVFDISNPRDPQISIISPLDDYYETLFSMNDNLFMGASLGVFIYDAANPMNITKTGSFAHVRSCDPVIAEGAFAFVTAWSGNVCGGGLNELDVLDITKISDPVLKNSYKLTNPRGLAKDGDLLFICDGQTGLGSYRITNGSTVQLLQSAEKMETSDVIASSGVAIVSARDGIYEYSYTADGSLQKLSKITVDGAY